jgi:glycosyltransferase family protein
LGASLFAFTTKRRRAFREWADDRIIKIFENELKDFISKYPKTYNSEETINHIIQTRCSVSRFGDGEFKLIIGERHKSFQDVNTELNRRMLEVLRSDNKNIMIGIYRIVDLEHMPKIWKKFAIRIGPNVLSLLDSNRKYYSAMAFRDIPTDSKENFIKRVKLVKQIWQDREVVIVVGTGSRFIFEEDLFNNIASVNFVYGPAKNAFDEYDRIIDDVCNYPKSCLILIVLGPTATVMAYDLALKGYQAIDFGQMPGLYRKGKELLFGDIDRDILNYSQGQSNA